MSSMTWSWYWKRLRVMSVQEVTHRFKCKLANRVVLPRVLNHDIPPLSWEDIAKIHNVNKVYWSSWNPGEFIHGFNHKVHYESVDWFKQLDNDIRVDGWSPDYHNTETVGDVKLLWEISRFKELVAWSQMGLFDRISQLLNSWIAENPPYTRIHWTSALEAAIRSFALIRVLAYADSVRGQAGGMVFIQQIRRLMFWNGWFISSNLSLGSSANNHLLGEALGLYACGLAFGQTALGQKWVDQARRLFETEYLRQTYASGVLGEGSLYYQCYVADMGLLYCLVTPDVPDLIRTRVARVTDSILWWSQWSDTLPLIGDDDGGIFTPHGETVNYYTCYHELRRLREAVIPDVPIEDAPSDDFVMFDAGQLGQFFIRIGPFGLPPLYAHSHADLGSIIGFRNKKPLLVDPGTGRYFETGGLRTQVRQSSSHNGVWEEASPTSMNGPFMWEKPPQSVRLEQADEALAVIIKSGSIETVRKLWMDGESCLVIQDTVYNPLARRVYQTWNFPAKPVVLTDAFDKGHADAGTTEWSGGSTYALGDLSLTFSSSPSPIQFFNRPASTEYNTIVEVPSLVREDSQTWITWMTVITSSVTNHSLRKNCSQAAPVNLETQTI